MTVNEYKEFIKNRYDEEPSESMIKRFCEINDIPYGMPINERMAAKTCENHGLSYTPPLDCVRYPAPEFEQFWGCEV
jgi:hypothetical protein